MKTIQFKTFLSALLFVVSMGVYAQSVSGTVSSEDGPLPGATVVVKGTSNGTTTDFDGNFSIEAGADDVLVVSFVGFATQEVAVGGQDQITVSLAADNELEEVVVTGYGSQRSKEITSAVVKVDQEEFNRGTINNANQLLQGKVAGLSIYNRGGNPNSAGVVRLRGISTVGANVQPLVVVDGIIGASLDNVDPADIETINVLKDGSAAAIYGSRGSAGVILVTTKRGADGSASFEYNGQFAMSTRANSIDVLTADEFTSGNFGLQGFDLGAKTDWLDVVSRDANSMIHNFSVAGGTGNTVYRLSANLREVEGILLKSGFDQFNTRASIQTTALDDKLRVSFNTSYTKREQENGFNEAFRYAVTYNPSAPIYRNNNPEDGFFEIEGLFDSFNPYAILMQNINEGERTEFNYGLNLDYDFTEKLSATVNIANQSSMYSNREYYSPESFFRGNATSPLRRGEARFFDNKNEFKLYEVYARYNDNFGSTNLSVTGGYSYQQNNYSDKFFSLGDFPSNDFNYLNAIEVSQDLQNAGFINASSNASPDEKIIAMFARANVTIDDAIFINASVRREGSTKLGADNQWGIFPSVGLGVDLNKYLNLGADKFKFRVGYGVTGALPGQSGLTQPTYAIQSDALGNFSSAPSRAPNPDLKWEEKAETNIGIEYRKGKLDVTLDYYTREIKDFILEVPADVATTGFPSIITNAGTLSASGIELALNYDVVNNDNASYSTGIVLSNTQSTLDEFIFDGLTTRANLGAPGQNGTNVIKVQAGDQIGDIWGPIWNGTVGQGTPGTDSAGAPGVQDFVDVNGDGTIIAGGDQGQNPDADFAVLGNGIPDLELGWSNNITIGDWNINAFFRGAFGHSLVNSFRAFYEPRVATQGSYNLVNTSLANNDLTQPQFSSLYVEKADFLKLDNLTVSRKIDTNLAGIDALTLSLSGQNLFVITDYTGTDPEPSLVDTGAADNGGGGGGSDVLAPGIDRRNNYFFSRTFTLGVNIKF